MSDPPPTRAVLRTLLIERIGDAPVEVAFALRESGTLNSLAALAGDRDLSPRQRSIGLLAVALVLADDPTLAVPDAAFDAVDDPAVVTAAIDLGLAAALTGVLAAASRDATLRPIRIAIGRRLLASGDHGPHVIQLLLDAGDLDRAAEAAAIELADLAPAAMTPLAWARLHLLVQWSADEAFFAATIRALATRAPGVVAKLDDLLAELPGADASAVARTRAAIGWALR